MTIDEAMILVAEVKDTEKPTQEQRDSLLEVVRGLDADKFTKEQQDELYKTIDYAFGMPAMLVLFGDIMEQLK